MKKRITYVHPKSFAQPRNNESHFERGFIHCHPRRGKRQKEASYDRGVAMATTKNGRAERRIVAARASFDSLKRAAATPRKQPTPGPHRYGWLCKQDGRKVDRIARSRVTIIYLPAGPERRVSELTRILRPTKTPTQKFAWLRGRFTRVPTPLVGAGERLA